MSDFTTEIDKQLKNTNFKVTKIPVETLQEFKLFCKKECGDIYWVGIFQLLKMKKQYEHLYTQFNSLQKQINELKDTQNKQVEGGPRTFGK